jgi:hypothetical protein
MLPLLVLLLIGVGDNTNNGKIPTTAASSIFKKRKMYYV